MEKDMPSAGGGSGRKPARYEVVYQGKGGAWLHLPWSKKKSTPKLEAKPVKPVKKKDTKGWF
jgi:hypothetical protein